MDAFTSGNEFCHVHVKGDSSLHASLPLPLAAEAERAGWAEPHFLVHTRRAPVTLVMLYAPRDEGGRDLVLRRVRASYEFALGPKGAAMPIHVVGPRDGEPSGGSPIRCRILEDGAHTQHRLGLIGASVPPGPAGPPQHVHRQHDEIFIVAKGKLRFTAGSEPVDVEAGSCVTVPLGTPHTFANPFDEPPTFVCTLTPDRHIEDFRDLSRPSIDAQGQLDPADVGRAMADYATEVIR